MIENVSTQLTVFHCFAHCLLPGRAFASLYVLLFLEKEAEIGGRDIVGQRYNYALRNADHIQSFRSSSNLFSDSFFSSTITVWHSLQNEAMGMSSDELNRDKLSCRLYLRSNPAR